MIFRPDDGYAGVASFTLVADDGWSQSAPGTVNVTVSAAPLLKIDFAARNPQIDLGNSIAPVLIGDLRRPGERRAARRLRHAVDDGLGGCAHPPRRHAGGGERGFAVLVARRGSIQAATAVVAGRPNRFDNIQLAAGLDIYPQALTLVPDVGQKQVSVEIAGVAGNLSPGAAGTLYYAGNSNVVSVGPDGLVRAGGTGLTEVTVVYKGREFVIPVRVQAPVPDSAVLGSQGGAIVATDGAVLAIPPDSLAGTQTVSLTTVAQKDLPIAVPFGWSYLAGYNLQFDGAMLANPAQLAIPVDVSIPVGKQLFLFRAGTVPDENGNLTPIWYQDEVAVVGADHVARTSSPPYPGVRPAGVYFLADPPEAISVARGVMSITFPSARCRSWSASASARSPPSACS